ncbi:MAG: hypothetical protein ICV62_14435 [Cyanobacteria bacterium Co-bin13]|nr:hypothetical protein [Cyanobacteria bacterium Co-bin13]
MQEFEPTQPSAAKGNSTWKWVAIGCGGCLGLSVLSVIALTVLFNRALNFSIDPENVEQQAQGVFDYEIPGESRGLLNMNIMGVEVAQIADTQEPPSVLLTVGRLPSYLQDEPSQTSMLDSFQESMAQDGEYTMQTQRTENLPLCGQTVPVRIEEGTFQSSGQVLDAVSYLAVVDHAGTNRFAWILTNGEQADANAKSVFDSLVCK